MRSNARVFALLALAALVQPAWSRAQDAGPHDTWEPEIRAFEEADRAHMPAPGGVVFVGSSSIRLWTTLAEDFPSVRVVNRGFGGSEIADSTFFAGRIVTPYKPRMVVLYAGDNDIANGRTPDQVLADVRAFVERVRKDLPNAKIAFVSIKPSPARAALLGVAREANAKVQDSFGRGQDLVYVDVFAPMLGPDGAPRPELFGEDRLHMNRAGYELWIKVLGPVLR